jgi:hypothetical protein
MNDLVSKPFSKRWIALAFVMLIVVSFGLRSCEQKRSRDNLRSAFERELDLVLPGLKGDLPLKRQPRTIGVEEPSRNFDGVLSGAPGGADTFLAGTGPDTSLERVDVKKIFEDRVPAVLGAGWKKINQVCDGPGRLPTIRGRFRKQANGKWYAADLDVRGVYANFEAKDLKLPNWKYPPMVYVTFGISRSSDSFYGTPTPEECDGFDGSWPVGEFAEQVSDPPPYPPLERQPNCEQLRWSYARGVGRSGVTDKSGRVVINPGSYENNKHLDFDNDGIACEDGQLKKK